MSTKAEAKRWLERHVGASLLTHQISRHRLTPWEPGPRVLARKGRTQYTLNGSVMVPIDGADVTVEVTDDSLIITTSEDDGNYVTSTRYTVMDPYYCEHCAVDGESES